MVIQIKDLLGWKKSRRHYLSKVGIAESTRVLGRNRPVTVLSAYGLADLVNNGESATCKSRDSGILLLRRAQTLQ